MYVTTVIQTMMMTLQGKEARGRPAYRRVASVDRSR